MEDKLELKHWTSYLPHKVQLKYCVNKGTVWTLDETNINSITTHDKLILRPLSDLTKEIEVNGEKFVPLHKIQIYESESLLIHNILCGFVEVIVFDLLLKWHLDVFGLIEKGLAIDINSLQK